MLDRSLAVLDPALAAIARRALAIDPRARFPNLDVLRGALARLPAAGPSDFGLVVRNLRVHALSSI